MAAASLKEITVNQVRRFADTARLPVSPLWQIVTETYGQIFSDMCLLPIGGERHETGIAILVEFRRIWQEL